MSKQYGGMEQYSAPLTQQPESISDSNTTSHQINQQINQQRQQVISTYLPIVDEFVFHQQELSSIDNKLANSKNKMLVLNGPAGAGKSVLAAEYARRNFTDSNSNGKLVENVLWVNADDPKKVELFYRNLSHLLPAISPEQAKPSSRAKIEDVVKFAHKQIESLNKPVLMVFDNLTIEHYHTYKATYLGKLPDNVRVIITTKTLEVLGDDNELVSIEVSAIDENEVKKYLHSKLTLNDKIKATVEDIDALIEHLASQVSSGNESFKQNTENANELVKLLPFKITMAVQAILSSNLGDVNEYLEYVKKYSGDREVAAVLEKLLGGNSLAWEMLQYSTLLDCDFISFKLLEQICGIGDGKTKGTEESFSKAISQLETLAAASVVWQGGESGLRMHELMQGQMHSFAMRDTDKVMSPKLVKEKVMLGIDQVFTDVFFMEDYSKELSTIIKLLPHTHKMKLKELGTELALGELGNPYANYASYASEDMRQVAIAKASIFNKLGSYFYKVEVSYDKAREYYEAALKMREQLFGGDHLDLAQSYNNLGLTLRNIGGIENIREGIKLQELALGIRKSFHENANSKDSAESRAKALLDVAYSYSNLGMAYKRQGDEKSLLGGVRLIEQALEISKEVEAKYSAVINVSNDIARFLNNLGWGYKDLGGEVNISKAIKCFEEALVIRRELYGQQDNADLAISLNSLGEMYKDTDRGGFTEAKELLEEALKIRISINSSQGSKPNRDLAWSKIHVGSLYVKTGKVEEGLKLQKEGLQLQREVVGQGKYNADLAAAISNVAVTYRDLGGAQNLENALKLFSEAIDICQNHLFKNIAHPLIARTLYHLAKLHQKLAEFDGNSEKLEQALEIFSEALVMQQELYPTLPHKHLIDTHRSMGEVMMNMADPDLQQQAREHLDKAEQLKAKANDGEKNDSTNNNNSDSNSVITVSIAEASQDQGTPKDEKSIVGDTADPDGDTQ